jgi:lipopolysaccharide export system ATP-binding protein
MHRFIPAIASWAGVTETEIPVNHRPRKAGRSKYGISRTIRVFLDLITVKFLLSFSTKPIQIFGLIGPNGAGKTTTFYMIVGFIQADSGSIFLNEEEITLTPMFRRARMGIGYLAQEASVFRKLSVEQNIMSILENTPLPRDKKRERMNPKAFPPEAKVNSVIKSGDDQSS